MSFVRSTTRVHIYRLCLLLKCPGFLTFFLLSNIGGYVFEFCALPGVLCSWMKAIFNIHTLLGGHKMGVHLFPVLINDCILVEGVQHGLVGSSHILTNLVLLGSLIFPSSLTFLTHLHTPLKLRFGGFCNMCLLRNT